MKAYTDASVSCSGTIHSYIVYNELGDIILRETLKSDIKNTVKAEIASIIALLMRCKDNSINNLSIYTDCKSITNFNSKSESFIYLSNWLLNLLDKTQAQLSWISRKLNKVADRMCRLGKSKIDKLESIDFQHMIGSLENSTSSKRESSVPSSDNSCRNISYVAHLESHLGRLRTVKCRVRRGTTSDRNAIREDYSDDEKALIYTYYSRLVSKEYRLSIEDIVKSADNGAIHRRKLLNTRLGRLVLVEKFIEKYHKTCHLDIRKVSELPFYVYNPRPLRLKLNHNMNKD